jgi:hypothetical protein
MTPEDFRRLALAMPEAIEAFHMGHPDFRVAGRIFATLGSPDAAWGMVKLTTDQQEMLVAAAPKVFKPVPGGWGRRGSTHVHLTAADETTLTSALTMAWWNIAPKSLVARGGQVEVRKQDAESKKMPRTPSDALAGNQTAGALRSPATGGFAGK